MQGHSTACPKCQGRFQFFGCSLCKGESEVDYHSGRQWLQNQWRASRLPAEPRRVPGLLIALVILLVWIATTYFMVSGQPLP